MTNLFSLFKTTQKSLTAITLAGLMLGITACQGPGIHQAYSGAPRTANEIATFTIPEEFNLLYIDSERYKSSFIQDGAVLQILPGEHQFVIKYQDFWEISPDEHERIESQPFALSFTAVAGNNFGIEHKKLEEIEVARAYAKDPKLNVKNLSTNTLAPTEIKYRLKDKTYLSNFVKSGFSSDNPATPGQPQQVDVLERLKYWWQEAESQQQEIFRQWLESQ